MKRFVKKKYKKLEFEKNTQICTLSSDLVTVSIDGVEQKEFLIISAESPCEVELFYCILGLLLFRLQYAGVVHCFFFVFF